MTARRKRTRNASRNAWERVQAHICYAETLARLQRAFPERTAGKSRSELSGMLLARYADITRSKKYICTA